MAIVTDIFNRLQGSIDELSTEVRLLRKKLFGQKSEKVAEGQFDLFREMLVTLAEQAASQDPDPISEPSPEPSKRLKPHPKRRTLIPTESQNIEVPESSRPCPEYGKHRTVIGHKRAMVIEYEPPKFRVSSYLREKRACRACEGRDDSAAAQRAGLRALAPRT